MNSLELNKDGIDINAVSYCFPQQYSMVMWGKKKFIMRTEYGETWIHSHNGDCNVNGTLCKHNPPHYNLRNLIECPFPVAIYFSSYCNK